MRAQSGAFRTMIRLSRSGFPFAFGRDAGTVGRFRALARAARLGSLTGAMRLALFAYLTLSWPFAAAFATRGAVRQARAAGHHYSFGEAIGILRTALRHNVPPYDFCIYGLERPEQRKDLGDYVFRNDALALEALNERLGAVPDDVGDKNRFARICESRGLAHVATLALFEGGRQVFPDTPFRTDEPALWIKPLRRKFGSGSGRKLVLDGDAYRDGNGTRHSAALLGRDLGLREHIVQPLLRNHPDIERLSNGALAAARIVTGLDAAGGAECVSALLVLPHGRRASSVGGIFCAIEPGSGRLRVAIFADGRSVDRHPDTGEPIADTMVPHWPEALALALRAHATAFSRFAFLGWDVALTVDGPVLLEANAGWGFIPHQLLDGPLGKTAFARLIAQYV